MAQRLRRNAASTGRWGAGGGLCRLPGVHERQGGSCKLVSAPAAGPARKQQPRAPNPSSPLLLAARVACRRVDRCGWRHAPPQQQRPQPCKRGARLQAATSPPFFERQGGSSGGAVPGGGAGAAAVEAAGGAALAVPPATPAAERIGVLLLNLGGPDSLDDVQPFLYNLFADPDIIRLPSSVQFLQPAIAQLISTVSCELRLVGVRSFFNMQQALLAAGRRPQPAAASRASASVPAYQPAYPPAAACLPATCSCAPPSRVRATRPSAAAPRCGALPRSRRRRCGRRCSARAWTPTRMWPCGTGSPSQVCVAAGWSVMLPRVAAGQRGTGQLWSGNGSKSRCTHGQVATKPLHTWKLGSSLDVSKAGCCRVSSLLLQHWRTAGDLGVACCSPGLSQRRRLRR